MCTPFADVSDLGVCPEPGGVANTTRFGALFPYQTGDKVNYRCNDCYLGGGTRVCQHDGYWSVNYLTFCSGTHICSTRNISKELAPSKQPSSILVLNDKEQQNLHQKFMSHGILHSVVPFYIFHITGYFERRKLYIHLGSERRVNCGDPPTLANGQRFPPDGLYCLGDNVFYTCDAGYEMKGESTIRCTNRGQFNKPIPTCVEQNAGAIFS